MLLLGIILLYAIFHRIIDQPSAFVFGAYGDALKNYYTFVHYVLHGGGFHFSGMNYPYGEHITFTDNQPAVAMLCRFIHQYIVDLSGHTVGIMNLWLIGSMLLGIMMVFLVMRELEVPAWYAAVISLIVIFLSPQINRLGAHYALSHTFIIPGLWYFMLRIHARSSSWLLSFILGLFVLCTGLIHPYFLIMGVMFVLGYNALYVLWDKRRPKRLVPALTSTSATILAFALFFLWLKLTDSISDRPMWPYGIDVCLTRPEAVFLPVVGPITEIFTWGHGQPEGWGYIGFSSVIILVYLAIKITTSSIRHNRYQPIAIFNKSMEVAFFLALFFYAFASGAFHLLDVFGIVEVVPQIAQFRSPGRFIWLFYYLITVVTAVSLYRWTIRRRKSSRVMTIAFILIGSWAVEAYWNAEAKIPTLFKPNRALSAADNEYVRLLGKGGYSPDDFQAVWQLPTVVLGPELLTKNDGEWTFREGVRCAFQTGLPLMDIMLSRTSISQALNLVQLLGDVPRKDRLLDMNDKPILLVCEEQFMSSPEIAIMKSAVIIGKTKDISLYSLAPSQLRIPVDSLLQGMLDLHISDTLITSSGSGCLQIDHFDPQFCTGYSQMGCCKEDIGRDHMV